MPAIVTSKDQGTSLTNPTVTGSLSWLAGSRPLLAVVSAYTSGASGVSHAVTGGGVTWSRLGSAVPWGVRRWLELFGADGTPSSGALTITASGTGTYEETMWAADQIANPAASPYGTPTVNSNAPGPTSLSAPDIGTIGSQDLGYATAAFENGSDSFAWQAGTSDLAYQSAGANVRSLRTGYTATDDTPGVQWASTSYHCGIIGLVVFGVAGAGASAGKPVSAHPQRNRRHYAGRH